MDMTWVTDRIAVGGGIWNADNMADVARAGITHIVDMQAEFDDTSLAKPHGIKVLWNPVEDDFQPKPPEVFQRGVEFVQQALEQEQSKVFIHCAAGVHRAPMMTLAVLCSLGWKLRYGNAYDCGQTPCRRLCRSLCGKRGKIFEPGGSLGLVTALTPTALLTGASLVFKSDNKCVPPLPVPTGDSGVLRKMPRTKDMKLVGEKTAMRNRGLKRSSFRRGNNSPGCCRWLPCALRLQAQTPPTTTVSDTVFRADGSPARGTLLISWPAFTTRKR